MRLTRISVSLPWTREAYLSWIETLDLEDRWWALEQLDLLVPPTVVPEKPTTPTNETT